MLRILGGLTALVLVAGLGTGPATARPADGDSLPGVGECQALTAADLAGASIPQTPVDCAQPHTAVTIAVADLPDPLAWGWDHDAVSAHVMPVCLSALRRLVGRKLLLLERSQYTLAWFQPSEAEIAAGARWFSCHLTIAEDDRLASLPPALPRLAARMPDTIARCATLTRASTTCADQHTWRATYAFYVVQKPTVRHVAANVEAYCPRHIARGRAWMYTWRTYGEQGYIATCFEKNKR